MNVLTSKEDNMNACHFELYTVLGEYNNAGFSYCLLSTASSIEDRRCTKCQGPSHGGSYMDEGTLHIRTGLPPHIVSGDCLVSLSPPLYAFPIVCSRMFNVRWYRVVLVRDLLCSRFVYVPLKAILCYHVHVHLHGSLYPMMDYTLHVYYRLLTPCLLMFHGVHYNSFTVSHCTGFAVL